MFFSSRNGLLAWCGLSMLAFTGYQRLNIDLALVVSVLFAGALAGWLLGSGEWRAMGKDLVAAVIVVVCLLFGTVLPLMAAIKHSDSVALIATVVGLPLGWWLARASQKKALST